MLLCSSEDMSTAYTISFKQLTHYYGKPQMHFLYNFLFLSFFSSFFFLVTSTIKYTYMSHCIFFSWVFSDNRYKHLYFSLKRHPFSIFFCSNTLGFSMRIFIVGKSVHVIKLWWTILLVKPIRTWAKGWCLSRLLTIRLLTPVATCWQWASLLWETARKTMQSIRFNKVSGESLKTTPTLWRES